MSTYRGSCHCGAVTFNSLASGITELTTCDCPLCRQKNALMTKVHESALTVLSGKALLSAYEWNTHCAQHLLLTLRACACATAGVPRVNPSPCPKGGKGTERAALTTELGASSIVASRREF